MSAPHLDKPAVTLLDLPPELILEISSVDWKVIFALEQVCKTLKGILSDHSLWVSLVLSCFNTAHFAPRVYFLSRPIATYTASELRSLFVRWKKVEQGWQHEDARTFSDRDLDFDAIDHVLVPGGRWILLFDDDSSVSYIDLEAQILDPIPLIPCPCTDPNLCSWWPGLVSKLDIENDSFSLGISFRFAVTYEVKYNDGTEGRPVVHIWNISSVYDDNTGAETLAASKMAEFQIDLSCGRVDVYALEGNLVLLETRGLNFNASLVYLLVDWRKASDSAREPSCRIVVRRTFSEDITILNDALLMVPGVPVGLTWTTYNLVPQVPISDIGRYASTVSEVNYGRDVVMDALGHLPRFTHMSQPFYEHNDKLRSRRAYLLVDVLGQFFALFYSANDARGLDSPSVSCFPIGTKRMTPFDEAIMGHGIGIFLDMWYNVKVAIYPDALRHIHERLSEGQKDTPNFFNDEAFMNRELVTVGDMDPTLKGHMGDNVLAFDEGIGRILLYSDLTSTITIHDMII